MSIIKDFSYIEFSNQNTLVIQPEQITKIQAQSIKIAEIYGKQHDTQTSVQVRE